VSRQTIIDVAYLIAASTFVLALKGLSSPKRARQGTIVGAVGMAIAVAATFFHQENGEGLKNIVPMVIAMVLGVVIAVPMSRFMKMTSMPQLIAIFNGVGGGAAALVAITEFLHQDVKTLPTYVVLEVVLGVLIGAMSFSGSAIAYAKLQELMTGRPITYPGQQIINGIIFFGAIALVVALLISPTNLLLWFLLGVSLLVGVSFVLPIGGADVPVLISLLNSFTGLAVAASGFTLDSNVLIVAGTLVGASGILLTKMMSQAMGRSLPNVMFSAFGSATTGDAAGGGDDRPVRSGSPDDIAVMLAYARKVIIVPGYGLAVAQAQHTVNELAQSLQSRGIEVFYAIHPVAGRMPGHMNVLLAEANVPYSELKEMDEANPEMSTADVVLVVGANDTVNPAAKTSPGSPIYGMPIINADEAKQIVFLKRSMRPGFAGIENELLYDPKTILLFGDAKDSLGKLVTAVKQA
jgi:NAD(P) transhydrogenase subunit beta